MSHLTVSELTLQIRSTLEPAFQDVWVVGEVSNYRPAASGHVYFSLKDQNATISVAAFGWGRRKVTFALQDGLQILCHGKLSVYPPRGNYQLMVDSIEPMGAGSLQKAFEQLKAKLQGEGLFAPERKRPLPKFPDRIAVITSPSGAAIQDMLNILSRRAPHLRVTIIPAVVQGDDAPAQLIKALRVANRLRLGDIVVLARGGGSIEDLWCFNHEELARAIAQSELPVVSAVGHEIDFTISDFVSDLRAPTPSAAAEIISQHWVEVMRGLSETDARMKRAMIRDVANRKTVLSHVAARLVNPKDRLRELAQRFDDFGSRLAISIFQRLERCRQGLERSAVHLNALSPLKVLERGYIITKDEESGVVVRSALQWVPGRRYRFRFHDGETKARAE